MKIAVIGSGIGGLCCAIRLANKGHQVTVFEKNGLPGGKIAEIRRDGYRFDTGPSLFTLPDLIEQLFAGCGESLREYMPYRRLENNCKYFFSDGTRFNFFHDKKKLQKEVTEKTTEAYENIRERLIRSEELYKIGAPVFIFNDFHKLSNFNTPPFKRVVFQLHKFNFGATMHSANKKSFKDQRMVQLFDRYATYNGSDPYQAPATLNMIAHLENNIGAFFPEKGMYAIVDSLYRLAMELGVQFRFGTLVSEILMDNKKAVGIRVEGEKLEYDTVISGADVRYTAEKMMCHPLRKRLEKATPSSSALIFYWGIERIFPELDIHNILFSEDYKKEFDCIFRKKTITDDPTVYLFISSKVVKSDAPEGCENWFTMINVPANCGQDWEVLIRSARRNIIDRINRALGVDIEPYISFEQIGSPLSLEKRTLSWGGALYGTASNSMFSAFLRHPNSLRTLKNLYFVGGSVHPGGGIPLCVASSGIVCDEIADADGN